MHLGLFCYLYNAQLLLLSPVEISKGEKRTKVVAGGQECRKHNRQNCPPGRLKEEQACSPCLSTDEVKAATIVSLLLSV